MAEKHNEPLPIRIAGFFPWPTTLSIYLTLAVMGLAVFVLWQEQGNGLEWKLVPQKILVDGWLHGVMNKENIAFAFQMCLILVSGGALAQTPLGERIIKRLERVANLKRPMVPAIILLSLVAVATGLLNWGLSLVFCAILGRRVNEILRRRSATEEGFHPNFAVIGAACYLGMLVWHGGLSGTAPQLANDVQVMERLESVSPRVELQSEAGSANTDRPAPNASDSAVPRRPERIRIEETTFSVGNRVACVALWPILAAWLVLTHFVFFRKGHSLPPPPPTEPPAASPNHGSIISLWATTLLAILGLFAVTMQLASSGWEGYTVELFAIAMLCLSLIWVRPQQYVAKLGRTTGEVIPIVLQYPLYCGILGIMQADDFQLVYFLARQGNLCFEYLGMTSEGAFVVFTYFSACLTNLFVPSGGAQWLLQAPMFLQLAGPDVDRSKIVLAIAYGEQTTNMIQPFWVLTLCTIMRLRPCDILGYSALCMVPAAAVFLFCLLWF
ncbi:MAG: TIGR00366 family protein [Pirellulaceae bacterium]|nr:TIGR00366 family protein [Pirellulaceae bacterium]